MLHLVIAALIAASPAGGRASSTLDRSPGHTRVYYIAADEQVWDYAPSGMNQINGKAFNPVEQLFATASSVRIGSKFRKALFHEYTDATFSTRKPRPVEDAYLGLLGPVIRAEVGDSIRVVFRNNGTHPYSIHPHGVMYDKSSEGAGYVDGTDHALRAGDAVMPGATFTYRWLASERSGPGPMDGSSVLWMYHSHVNESADINAGLFGAMIVTARGKAKADGSPKDVDREIVMAFAEMDENLSWFIEDNIKQFALEPEKVQRWMGGPTFVHPFAQFNLRESMNGFIYGNGPMPTMREGEHVRWYLMSTTNFEIHAPHWHGNVVTALGMKTDVISLGTMGMVVADMVADNPGTWLFHCHVEPHMTAGMQSRFVVAPGAVLAGKPRGGVRE